MYCWGKMIGQYGKNDKFEIFLKAKTSIKFVDLYYY